MADTVVYYSMSGKSRQTAQEISDVLKVPLVAILEDHRRKYNVAGFIGGILDSAFRRTPGISLSSAMPLSRRIILCGPIWAGCIPGPIRSWLRDQGGQIADLIWVPHSGQARDWPKAIAEIAMLTGRAPTLVQPFSEAEFAKGIAAEKARSFAGQLMAQAQEKIAA